MGMLPLGCLALCGRKGVSLLDAAKKANDKKKRIITKFKNPL
jgi:hypothetical protein